MAADRKSGLVDIVVGKLLPQTIDWPEVLRAVRRYHCAPFVYRQLQKQVGGNVSNPAPIPTPIWQALQTAYYTAAAQDAQRELELRRVFSAFREARIPVLLLKGAALAQVVYQNVAVRPMIDGSPAKRFI